MMKTFVVGALVLTSFAWVGCESSEDDKIHQAQACLDRASDATSASECSSMVNGISGPRAGVIRCSAIFISEGFTTRSNKFINAFNALKNPDGSADKTVNMMQHLRFESASASTNADLVVRYCAETGIEGMIMFASMARMATLLNEAAKIESGTGTPTLPQLQAAVDNLTNQQTGEIALTVADTYCKDASTNNAEFCGQFNAATQDTSLTTEQIGCLLKKQFEPSIVCP